MRRRSPDIRAVMFTCASRCEEASATLAAFTRTDWGSPAAVFLNPSRAATAIRRMTEGYRQLLRWLQDSEAEYHLVFEDDVRFVGGIRRSLETWRPLVDSRPGEAFFATLFDPGFVPVRGCRRCRVFQVEARAAVGSVACLMSRGLVKEVLRGWRTVRGLQDRRLYAIAVRWAPILVHEPALAQHVGLRSTWGGPFLFAPGFQVHWRPAGGRGAPCDCGRDPDRWRRV